MNGFIIALRVGVFEMLRQHRRSGMIETFIRRRNRDCWIDYQPVARQNPLLGNPSFATALHRSPARF